MTDYREYRKVDGYEVHPTDIAEKLLTLADLDITEEEKDIARDQLTDALYYLDCICENPMNNDYHRTFYNVLATITEKGL